MIFVILTYTSVITSKVKFLSVYWLVVLIICAFAICVFYIVLEYLPILIG